MIMILIKALLDINNKMVIKPVGWFFCVIVTLLWVFDCANRDEKWKCVHKLNHIYI